jgi:hypothetical protein
MIAAALGRVGRGAVALYPIAERVFLAFEFTGLGLFVGKLGHGFEVFFQLIQSPAHRISFVPTKPSLA